MPDHTFNEPTSAFPLLTLRGEHILQENHPIVRVLHGEEPDPPTIYRVSLDHHPQRLVQIEAVPLIDEYGIRQGAIGVAQDVTSEYIALRQNEILRALAHACAGAAEVFTLAEAAIHVLLEGLQIPHCGIMILDPDRQGYARLLLACDTIEVPDEVRRHIQEAVANTLIAPDAPVIGLRVFATGEAQLHTTIATLKAELGETPTLSTIRNMSFLPLKVAQQTVGVISIGHDDNQPLFRGAVECELLEAIADEIGMALHRAQLYEEARRLALFDPLTGIYNHRALQHRLMHELELAHEQGMPISIVMLDIDHFRQFNESHGHDIGDLVLRLVARAIQNAVREGDFVARYGGEEFTLLLPGIAYDASVIIAERVRQSIATTIVQVPGIAYGLTITASLGLADFPTDATTPALLLKAADIALYAAKHGGRNQVAVFREQQPILSLAVNH